MDIAVTGAAGKLGIAVVEELRSAQHAVHAFDSVPFPNRQVESSIIDVMDYDEVIGALTAGHGRFHHFDVVVHLATIAQPQVVSSPVLLAQNLLSTYNVFSAVQAAGIEQVVWASSATLIGSRPEAAPPYLPVDESSDLSSGCGQPLATALDEILAEHFARRNPDLSIVGLRLSEVMDDADYPAFASWQDRPDLRAANLWGYVDARDAAQAVHLAFDWGHRGAESFVIAAADTVMRRPTSELITGRLAELARRSELPGRASLLSIAKAQRILGYEPLYSWVDRV